jgi:hypothetical protein
MAGRASCESSQSLSATATRNLTRWTAVAAAGLALVAAGCGGDKDNKGTASAPRTSSGPAGKAPAKAHGSPGGGGKAQGTTTGASPEDQPGGAGDEEGARTPAMFTGRNSRITPTVVRVAPFIAIRVELRSGDGAPYALRFGNKVLRAGGPALSSMSTTLPGLHHGQSILGKPGGGGGGNRVRIVASAEPGP